MDKTTRIHLAGVAYDAAPDAGAALKAYVASIKKGLSADTSAEVMADIEARITEILQSRNVAGGGTISADDVAAIKKQLGEPQHFAELQEVSAEQSTQRSRNLVWMISGVALAVLTLVGITMLLTATRPEQQETQTQAYEQKITRLELDIDSGDVKIAPSTNGKVSVERDLRWTSQKPGIQEEVAGETLRITSKCPQGGTWWLNSRCSMGYTVKLPAGAAIELKVSAGIIDVRDMLGELHLDTSAGNIDVLNSVGKVFAETSAGNVTLKNAKSTDVDVRVSSGNVELGFAVAPKTVFTHVSSGNIEVTVPRGEAYKVTADTSAGQRTVNVDVNSAAERSIEVDTSSGNVVLQYSR